MNVQLCSIFKRLPLAGALLAGTALVCILSGCTAHPELGRAETLYKSLGGPDFVGKDGGISSNIVFNWFDSHYENVAKFNGQGGVCNGYEPAGELAQRERVVCAGASHAWLSHEMTRERAH